MVIGITMLKVVPGQEKACFDVLRKTAGVKEIYHLFGKYDIFVMLEALDNRKLSLLLEDIRDQKYILDAWSLLVSETDKTPDAGVAFSRLGELAIS